MRRDMRRLGEDERWTEAADRKLWKERTSGSTILYLTLTPVEKGTRGRAHMVDFLFRHKLMNSSQHGFLKTRCFLKKLLRG